MAIYDHKYGELSYFRVFRAWGGEEHQEYVRIKRSRDTAHKKALEIDARFEKSQKAYCLKLAMSPEYHVRSDGRIRGLRRILVKRKGRSPSDVFELRVNVPWENEIKRTTISVSVHGAEKAYKLSIDKICEWYGLKPQSQARRGMIACNAYYLEELQKQEPELKLVDKVTDDTAVNSVAEQAYQKAKEEIANLRGGLLKGLKRFTA